MKCRKCGSTIPEPKLVCVYCTEKASSEAYLKLQRNYIPEILSGETKLQLAPPPFAPPAPAAIAPSHIQLIQERRHAYCGAELSHQKRSQHSYQLINRDLICPACLEVLDKMIKESPQECHSD
jgi:hypothetical protein